MYNDVVFDLDCARLNYIRDIKVEFSDNIPMGQKIKMREAFKELFYVYKEKPINTNFWVAMEHDVKHIVWAASPLFNVIGNIRSYKLVKEKGMIVSVSIAPVLELYIN